MKPEVARLRMFAGPNGSGKSTIRTILPSELLGLYVNPDDIEKEAKSDSGFDFTRFQIHTSIEELKQFFSQSKLLDRADVQMQLESVRFDADKLKMQASEFSGYFTSVVCDFIRKKLVAARHSFSFETVMSHPDKVQLLADAQSAGYRTYLYYVATEDPLINLYRIRNRVKLGGHPVPEDKIEPRYRRSLQLLSEAIHHANRAYIFDNSGGKEDLLLLAEVESGELRLKSEKIPVWFKVSVLDKLK